MFLRRRGASTERRQQLAWLGYVGVLTVVWIVLLSLAGLLVRGPDNGWVTAVFWSLMFLTPVAGIPLACVVAILKYRLYDLGRIVSRTVTYAIVTGLLVGLCAGLVLLATGGAPDSYSGGGGRIDACGGVVQPAAAAGAAGGGPAVQPGPV